MEQLTPQQINYEAFKCELRIMPEIKSIDYSAQLNSIDSLSAEEKRNLAGQIFVDKKQSKETRTKNAIKLWHAVNDDISLLYSATAYFIANKPEYGFKDLVKSAKLGNNQATLRLAYCHLMGIGTTLNVDKACELFKRLAHDKIPDAVYFMGAMFLIDTINKKSNPTKAKTYLDWSIQHGCKFALFEHGATLLKSEESKNKGIEYIIKAAKKQEVRAMMWLAIELTRGETVPRDIKAAQRYLEKCYNLGFKPAVDAVTEVINEE